LIEMYEEKMSTFLVKCKWVDIGNYGYSNNKFLWIN
jgi:hypothetical protein